VNDLEELIQRFDNAQSDKDKSKKKMTFYEKKIEELITQMDELSADLMDSREKEKKC
jgi:phage shock protein A